MQSKPEPNYDVLFYVILYVFYAFLVLFVYCEFGQHLSSGFELLNDDIYQFNWHLLPVDLQRTWNIILVTTQRPVQLAGFGNYICNRESFQRVNFCWNCNFLAHRPIELI